MTRPPRLKLESVETPPEGRSGWVEVALSYQGRRLSERSAVEHPGHRTEILRATALATIGAVERFVDGQFRCELKAVEPMSALDKDLVVLLIDLAFEGRRFEVVGSCQMTRDLPSATARAALDATNRHIGFVTELRQ